MPSAVEPSCVARYHGRRMTADEYYRLEDDGCLYELIDGVVCMSPSPTPSHQNVALHLAAQILSFVDQHAIGRVYHEVDVHLGVRPDGGDLVYRPDVVFLRGHPATQIPDRLVGVPDLVIEIVSPSSRRLDYENKKADYERCGVGEYWIVDPDLRQFTFYRLEAGQYLQIAPQADAFASQALPGFVLDLNQVRRTFA